MLECLKKGPSSDSALRAEDAGSLPAAVDPEASPALLAEVSAGSVSDISDVGREHHTGEGTSSDGSPLIESIATQPELSPAVVGRPALMTVFDVSDGQREFLTEEAAAELLKPLTDPGNAFSSICFSNRSFGEDAAKVAAKILESLRGQLVRVDLADIVAGRSEDEALAVMSIFSAALEGCNLQSLNLSDNALGEKGVRAFSALLKSQSALEELYFMNNGISEEAAVAICELLPSAEKLRVLHFHNNMTGDAGAIALSRLVTNARALEDFRFSSTRVAAEGGIALAHALLSGSRLRKIDLRDNPFGEEVAIPLSRPLKHHMGLTEIFFSYIGLEDKGTKVLLEALKVGAPGLQVLDLAGNDITRKSANLLADCISTKTHLTKLNLSENELLDRGVVTVCNALLKDHDSLLELDLCETEIGRIGACAAAKAVVEKPDFRLLKINGNHISEFGVEAVKAVLQKARFGTSVLGPLDENEDEGEDDGGYYGGHYDEDDAEDADVDDELQTQLSNVRM